MAEQKIDLRKVRDFSACISDAFVFIRQNAGPLLKSFFAICAVFMLTQAIYNGFYQARSMRLLGSVMNGGYINWHYFQQMLGFRYILLMVLAVLTLVSMQVALVSYIKCYLKNHEMPGIEEVWLQFRRYILIVFMYKLPILAAIAVGCCLCLVPGFYLAVVLIPFTLVVMIEEKGFFDAISRCFELIKNNFWPSVAVYLVAYIIYLAGSMSIGLVVSGAGGLIAYLTTSELSTSMGVVSSFLNIFSFSFYVIFFICVAFNYFSLVEQRDGVGLINRIDRIGDDPAPLRDTEDQY